MSVGPHINIRFLYELFPQVSHVSLASDKLAGCVKNAALRKHYVLEDDWFMKIMQFNDIMQGHHGVMLVGQSGCGKTAAWQTLLEAQKENYGMDIQYYIMDSKVMSKNDLYGYFDAVTREWTDGLFTSILRRIVDNVRGEQQKKHWVVFDGDVDSEWVENLNRLVLIVVVLTLVCSMIIRF